ncbi:MAG: hypothetical protein ACOYLM_11815 [Methylococcaceae bacterium]|jgi:predicted nucleotidyltransferase
MSGFSRNDPNIAMLEHVAVRLGVELCRRVVFVGGAAAGLLITDLAAPTIRRTDDVDIVDPALVLEEFQRLEAQLRAMGFEHDHSSDVICRWIIDGVSVDIMPSREEILGFTNKWYPLGIETSVPYALGNGMEIRVIRAPEFIATKLEAFHGRGGGDYLSSHDLEDIISVIDGRDSLLFECQDSKSNLRGYLGEQFDALLKIPAFLSAIPGFLPPDPASQERVESLLRKLQALSYLLASGGDHDPLP